MMLALEWMHARPAHKPRDAEMPSNHTKPLGKQKDQKVRLGRTVGNG